MSTQSQKLVEAIAQDNQTSRKEISGKTRWTSPHLAALAERHSYLVDKKYGGGLSKEETEELANLKRQMDDETATFYEPIIQQLTDIVERLRAKSQQPEQE